MIWKQRRLRWIGFWHRNNWIQYIIVWKYTHAHMQTSIQVYFELISIWQGMDSNKHINNITKYIEIH